MGQLVVLLAFLAISVGGPFVGISLLLPSQPRLARIGGAVILVLTVTWWTSLVALASSDAIDCYPACSTGQDLAKWGSFYGGIAALLTIVVGVVLVVAPKVRRARPHGVERS